MGTKRTLARHVRCIVSELRPGPLLDAFCGMCAVGEALSSERPVWSNDVQYFAATVARSMLASSSASPIGTNTVQVLTPFFRKNSRALVSRFAQELRSEDAYLDSGSLADLSLSSRNLPSAVDDLTLADEYEELSHSPTTFPYRLFTIAYGGTYFSLRQCIELDSIRYAIDRAVATKDLSSETRRFALVALGLVASRVNNSTGHFAQFLTPTERNFRRVLAKRRRSVWSEFISVLGEVKPVGTTTWRRTNRTFRADALELLESLLGAQRKPSIVYADPPYTKAQYSRYYHLLDTLVRYNYPALAGAGRYPDDRFTTPFSHKGKVADALTDLVRRVAKLEADLIMSYPANGLYVQVEGDLRSLLDTHYDRVALVARLPHRHSSFGGPRADPKNAVEEHVFLAENRRI